MKTNIVNEAVRGESVALALKSGTYTVAGTGLCGLGSVLDTAADIGQKVVDAARAAGEACTKKGEEFLAEAAAIKGEEPAKKKEKSSKTWSLADFVAQHNEFAAAASAVIKEYTKVVFRAEGSMKGVVTAFDATRRSDGAHCSVFADMANKTFSVVAPPKKGEKPVKKAAKKAAAPKQEKSSKKAPAKEAVKKAEGKKEPYSSNPKADMALEEAVNDHGEWLDKVIRHFQTVSTKALANVVVKSNYLKFSSYGENGQDNAVSVAFKSHTVKVNRKVVKLDL